MRYKLFGYVKVKGLIFLFLCCFVQYLNAQSLQGTWVGKFNNKQNRIEFKSPTHKKIKLKIILNLDSSYTVYCYSKDSFAGSNLNVVSKASLTFVNLAELYIKEYGYVQNINGNADNFKEMHLFIKSRENKQFLEGTWQYPLTQYFNGGDIKFVKRNNKKPKLNDLYHK